MNGDNAGKEMSTAGGNDTSDGLTSDQSEVVK